MCLIRAMARSFRVATLPGRSRLRIRICTRVLAHAPRRVKRAPCDAGIDGPLQSSPSIPCYIRAIGRRLPVAILTLALVVVAFSVDIMDVDGDTSIVAPANSGAHSGGVAAGANHRDRC